MNDQALSPHRRPATTDPLAVLREYFDTNKTIRGTSARDEKCIAAIAALSAPAGCVVDLRDRLTRCIPAIKHMQRAAARDVDKLGVGALPAHYAPALLAEESAWDEMLRYAQQLAAALAVSGAVCNCPGHGKPDPMSHAPNCPARATVSAPAPGVDRFTPEIVPNIKPYIHFRLDRAGYAMYHVDHARIVAVKDAEIDRLREVADTLGMASNQLHERAEAMAGLLRVLYDAAAKGFHVSESCGGPDGHYMHVSKFQTLTDLQAYDDAWRAAMISVRDGQATPENPNE